MKLSRQAALVLLAVLLALLQRLSMALVLSVFLLFSAALGILLLYLVKSALGIDLIPGFSFGVWGWFQHSFLK